MNIGSSSNGNTGTARVAAPCLLPLAPDSMLESFSEYGGMTLNSSLASSSCSSSSLSSICKSGERVIFPINGSGGAWMAVQHVNFKRKTSTQNFKLHMKIRLQPKQPQSELVMLRVNILTVHLSWILVTFLHLHTNHEHYCTFYISSLFLDQTRQTNRPPGA